MTLLFDLVIYFLRPHDPVSNNQQYVKDITLRKSEVDLAENLACRVFTSNLDNQGDITLPSLVPSDPF